MSKITKKLRKNLEEMVKNGVDPNKSPFYQALKERLDNLEKEVIK